MAWSGGVFTRARDWTADEAGSIDMLSVNFDQEDDNFESGINACLTKDGANSPSANLAMGGNRHTGVGNAAAKDDYASAADVIDQNLSYYVDTGAADAYVITPSPVIAAYAEGQRFVFRATNTNTGASTLNVNALGAIVIDTSDGLDLQAGMILAGAYYEVVFDVNGTPDRWFLMSPHSFKPVVTAGTGMTGGGTLPASITLNVIGGTGITANANDIATDDAAIVHDNLSGFVAGEHILHSGVTITAGAGMTGGGTIAATRTLNCIGGTGITVNANDIEVDQSTAWAWTGIQTFAANATFNDQVDLSNTWLVTAVISDSFTGTQNDYAPTGHATASVWRLTPSSTPIISGIAGGIAGRRIQLINLGSVSVTLQDENAGSTAANRIRTTGSGLAITEQGSVELWYDGTSSRWRIVSNP